MASRPRPGSAARLFPEKRAAALPWADSFPEAFFFVDAASAPRLRASSGDRSASPRTCASRFKPFAADCRLAVRPARPGPASDGVLPWPPLRAPRWAAWDGDPERPPFGICFVTVFPFADACPSVFGPAFPFPAPLASPCLTPCVFGPCFSAPCGPPGWAAPISRPRITVFPADIALVARRAVPCRCFLPFWWPCRSCWSARPRACRPGPGLDGVLPWPPLREPRWAIWDGDPERPPFGICFVTVLPFTDACPSVFGPAFPSPAPPLDNTCTRLPRSPSAPEDRRTLALVPRGCPCFTPCVSAPCGPPVLALPIPRTRRTVCLAPPDVFPDDWPPPRDCPGFPCCSPPRVPSPTFCRRFPSLPITRRSICLTVSAEAGGADPFSPSFVAPSSPTRTTFVRPSPFPSTVRRRPPLSSDAISASPFPSFISRPTSPSPPAMRRWTARPFSCASFPGARRTPDRIPGKAAGSVPTVSPAGACAADASAGAVERIGYMVRVARCGLD